MKGERASDLRRAHERWAWHTTNRAPHEELPRPLPLPIPFPSLTPSLSNLHHPRSTGGAIKEITLGGGVDANDDGGSGSRCMNFNTIIATKSSHPPFRQKKNRVPPPPHPICLAGRKKRHVYLLVCDEDALPCRPPRRAARRPRQSPNAEIGLRGGVLRVILGGVRFSLNTLCQIYARGV